MEVTFNPDDQVIPEPTQSEPPAMLGTVTAYAFDPVTGQFLYTTVADEDPLSPGHFLLPAYSTLEAPSAGGPLRIAFWTGDCWELKPNPATKPSPAHDWDEKKQDWILNKQKDQQLQANALAKAKRGALGQARAYADDLQAQVLGTDSPAEQQRLQSKYLAASAINAGVATEADIALLKTEAQLRPKYTYEQLVAVIIEKGGQAKAAEGMVNGLLLLAQDAVDKAVSLDELNASLALIKKQADTFKAEIVKGAG